MARPMTLLVNPTSGGGRSRARVGAVVGALRTAGFEADVVVTTSLEDVARVVGSAGPDGVVAVLGGDGTLGAAVEAAASSGTLLAPLPGGRGNDLCRALGVDPDPVRAARSLSSATERRIDAGRVAGKVFANVVSVGVDDRAAEIARTSGVPGGAAYVWGGLRALLSAPPVAVRVVVDGVATEHRAWFVSVSSSGWFGAGKHVAPTSLLDDGLLEVVVAEGMSRAGLVPVLLGLFTGRHVGRRGVTVRQGRLVRLEPLAGRVRASADGEAVADLPVDVEVLPGAVRVLC